MKDTTVNGWPVINRYLRQRRFTQNDLARALQISAAAVTHVKQGNSWLDAGQLAIVTRFLAMNAADQEEFYSQIFNARIIGDAGLRLHSGYECRRCQPSGAELHPDEEDPPPPRMPMARLAEFAPAVETFAAFVGRRVGNGNRPRLLETFATGLPGEPPLPPGNLLLLDTAVQPVSGDTVLARLHSGPFIIAEANWTEVLTFSGAWIDTKKTGIRWNYQRDPGWVLWMVPIRKLALEFAAPRSDNRVLTGS